LLGLALPDAVERDLELLGNERPRVNVYLDAYGRDYQNRPRGGVFHAPYGIRGREETGEGDVASTGDDLSGSLRGRAVALDDHCAEVAKQVRSVANACGLPIDRVNDLEVAGRLHDSGKSDSRFQAWLHYGDPLATPGDRPLAKSGRRLPDVARVASGLPNRWRHEARSVLM